jgi:ribosome biogenesis GTPase
VEGRVLVSYGASGVVELDDERQVACTYRRSVGRPYCGDRVEVGRVDGQNCVVDDILPRANTFARADARQRKQIIAANLDQVIVVIAPRPAPSRDLLERYLVACHSLDIEAVIVLNKAELISGGIEEPIGPLGRSDDYRSLGYRVARTSCKAAPGVEALLPILHDRCSILAGQSGVGKSSLVNRLLPDLDIQTGALSRATGKGVHTTTSTIMYRLPSGGRLIDSPGVWEYGLWPLSQDELQNGFIEFGPFAAECRFNDCHHQTEPGCAVRAAAEQGRIRDWRYASYLRLLQQLC